LSDKEKHLNRAIPPLAHTPMYVWHKYWGSKTWNVVGEHIEAYTKPGDTIIDPFCGSGVSGIEAVRRGRKAILVDLNPVACYIAQLTLMPVSTAELKAAYDRVVRRTRDRISNLYNTKCRKCGFEFPASCFIWENSTCAQVRYKACPQCEDRQVGAEPLSDDIDRIRKLETASINEWHPDSPLYYSDGTPFKKKEHYESLDELFTKRNLQALAWLMEAIELEKNTRIKALLKGGFSSMVHLCSRMCPALEAASTNHQTAFSSTWTQHSYWSAARFTEQNVWNKFESAIVGPQGLLNAKEESNRLLGSDVRIKTVKRVRNLDWAKADIYIINADCLEVMKELSDLGFEADYIFTDPAYGSSIQYGELSFLWAAWLKLDAGYVDRLSSHEIIENDRQGKEFEVYRSLLRNAFELMFSLLKPSHYLTMTFHSPAFKVRNMTIREGEIAGFDFQHIHHQPLAQKSGKSMLQPFGSAQGDFYLRFQKPRRTLSLKNEELFDAGRFERVIVESTKQVIAERAEPTPYTIIVNYIDPQLAKHGYWQTHVTGIDVNSVLRTHVGKEFCLIPVEKGRVKGKLWWLTDQALVRRLKETPLSERVEQSVFLLLRKKGRISFTDAWEKVSVEFPNSLTSDQMSIRQALEAYARPVSKGKWLLRPEIKERISEHNAMIERLAWIGMKHGYHFWIGKPEQSKRTELGLFAPQLEHKLFRDVMSLRKLQIAGVENLRTAELIDVLWLDGETVVAAFEVECTTQMTSALLRGSNLSAGVPKYMLIPEERERAFKHKMESPLFATHFQEENWHPIFFDAFREAFDKDKHKVALDSLIGIPSRAQRKRRQEAILPLL